MLSKKLPEIIKYICKKNIYSKDFIGKSCLLFRNDNFNFLKLETSNSEQNDAITFIQEIDKDFGDLDRFIERKRKLFENSLNKESIELLFKYCKTDTSITFANYKLFNKIKENLKIMIKNYFKSRSELYNNILKEIFVFDNKSHDIISLQSKLTYKSITDISKKTKIILLDLHITVFASLNNILSDIANEINVMGPIDAPTSDNNDAVQEAQPTTGGKSKNMRKINTRKHRNNSKAKKHRKTRTKRGNKRGNKNFIK